MSTSKWIDTFALALAAVSIGAIAFKNYERDAQLFFGAAPELDRYLDQIRHEMIDGDIKYVILRLRRIRNPDVVAVEHLEHFLRDSQPRGVTVLLAGVRPNLAKILRNLHFDKWLPVNRVYPEQEESILQPSMQSGILVGS